MRLLVLLFLTGTYLETVYVPFNTNSKYSGMLQRTHRYVYQDGLDKCTIKDEVVNSSIGFNYSFQ